MRRIYLDNNATTSVAPEVLEAVVEDLSSFPSNPSSVHFFGKQAKNRLAHARKTVADFLKVRPQELIFTSGGTEALSMLLRGFSRKKGHIITSNGEHSAVASTLGSLEKEGDNVTYLEAGVYGAVTVEAIKQALRPDTKFIILSAANNETGVKCDWEKIGALAKEKNIPFFVDAVALLGKEPFTIPEGVSAMCFSGHKIHAPKGVGALFVRSHIKLEPLFMGGDQELSRRAGTENISGIMGFAKAIALLDSELENASVHMKKLQQTFEKILQDNLSGVFINGEGPRVPNTSNLFFEGVDGETLLMHLDLIGVAASHGSACSSGSLEPSRILLNMGYSRERVRSSLRFSFSRFNTLEEVEEAARLICAVVRTMRAL